MSDGDCTCPAELACWLDPGAMITVFVLCMAALVADLKLPEFIVAGHKLESP